MFKAGGWIAAGLALIFLTGSLASHIYHAVRDGQEAERLAAQKLPAVMTVNEVEADIVWLRDIYRRMHPGSVVGYPIRSIDADLDKLQREIVGPISRLELYRRLAPILNTTGDEHTALAMPSDLLVTHTDGSRSEFPFPVVALDGRLFIGEARDAGPVLELAGLEVVSINQVSAQEVLSKASNFFSGVDARQRAYFAARTFGDALFLAFGFDGSFSLELRDPATGAVSIQTVAGKPVVSPRSVEAVALNRSPTEPLEQNQIQILDNGDVLFRFTAFDNKSGALSDLLDRAFAHLRSQDGRRLIIDMRDNGGGETRIAEDIIGRICSCTFRALISTEVKISSDVMEYFSSFIPAFLRWLPIQYVHPLTRPIWLGREGEAARITFDEARGDDQPKFNGKVFVVMDAGNYSAAATFLDTLKYYGFATLVGSTSGGYASHYGNVLEKRFPNSGLIVFLPTAFNRGHSTGLIEPDVRIDITPESLRSGADPALARALVH